MDSATASLIAWSSGLAAGGYCLFAIHVARLARRWPYWRVRATLLAAVLATVWAGLDTWSAFTGSARLATAVAVADTLRDGAWYAFLALLLSVKHGAGGGRGWVVPGGIGVVISSLVVVGVELAGSGDWLRTGFFMSLVQAVFGLTLLEHLWFNVAGDSRWNVKPLCIGLGSQWAFDLYLFADALMFNRLDTEAFAIRGLIHTLSIPLLVVATGRNRDWASKIRLSQKAAFHSTTLLMAGIYLLFMAGVGYYVRYFGGQWGHALQLAFIFAALLGLGIVLASGSVRAWLRVWIGKHFFRYRYDYREEWLRFTRTLSRQDSPQSMGQQVIRGLADLVESPAGALWLRESGQDTLIQAARWNMPANAMTLGVDTPLCRHLAESGAIVDLDGFRTKGEQRPPVAPELPAWLPDLASAWLVVPLVVNAELTGFVILAHARTPIDVDWEVSDLLRTAGCQAAGFLAKMQATEALLEARKFAAFNKMSAFVVHDLKNIVTQLSLMLRNAERHSDNPEFRRDMLATVEHAVERMRQLMLQLREGGSPAGGVCGVSLAEILERIRRGKAMLGREVEVTVHRRLAARGHEERLERVIGHLVQNALDATPAEGRVWVSLDRQGDRAVIEVGDTGRGMSEEFVRERLFKPFASDKPAGMGIGAYESAQYIRELGGELTVRSRENEGTRVTVALPLIELQAGSDLHEKDNP
jgi:putative PEP-CTERM system histidine kinase